MSLASELLAEGQGICRLAPTWVPRAFCRPGKRIKLHPDDYYILGLERGGIDDFEIALKLPNAPGTITRVGTGEAVPFVYEDGLLRFTVSHFDRCAVFEMQ